MTNRLHSDRPSALNLSRRWGWHLLFLLSGAAAITTAGDAAAQKQLPASPPPPAALTTPSWSAPACNAAAIQSPAGKCDGPWRFDWKRECKQLSCGYSNQCKTYATCQSWSHGITKSNRTESPSTSYTFTEKENCYANGDCNYTTSGSEPHGKCNSVANARYQQIKGTVPVPVGNNPFSTAYYNSWLSSFSVTGTPVVTDVTHTHGGSNLPNKPHWFQTVTTFKCSLSVVNAPSMPSAAAAPCACVEYEFNTCVCETGTTFTGAASDAAAPSSAGAGRLFAGPPACTTCDVPDLETGAPSLMSCLDDDPGDLSAEIQAARAARAKLALQLAGDDLSDDQRAQAEASYDTSDAAPACQVPLPVDASCDGLVGAGGVHLRDQLQLCSDMSAGHVPPGAAESELAHCAAVLDLVRGVPASSCRDGLLTAGSEALQEMIRKTLELYDASDGLGPELGASMRMLDSWYRAVEGMVPAGTLRAEAGALAGDIWKAAHNAALPLPQNAASDTQAAALLADAGQVGLEVDYDLLRAAFEGSQPMDSPAALYVVADGLRGTMERMEKLTPVHDVACRFRDCGPLGGGGAPLPTALAQAWQAIAALPDGATLAAVLADAPELAAQEPDFFDALSAISGEHSALAGSFQGTSGDIGTLAAGAPPIEGEGLAAMVRRARSLSDSYAQSGVFEGRTGRLSSAVLKREQLVGFIDYGNDSVQAANAAFIGARVATLNDLLAQIRGDGAAQSVADQMQDAVERMDVLIEDLGGLRTREAMQQEGLGELMSSFQAVVESGAFDAEAAYAIDVIGQRQIGPEDAHHTASYLDLPGDAASVDTLTSGQILQIQMTDATWTPTCALSISQISAPTGGLAGIESGAVCGPEGYALQWSNNEFSSHSVTDSQGHVYSNLNVFSMCVEAGLKLEIDKVLSVGIKSSFCNNTTWGYQENHTISDNTGNQSTGGASFASGLRLPITPVPWAPVGSLLAVSTVHNDPMDVLDIRVVQKNDSIVAPMHPDGTPGEVDVYLVVNDVDSPACPAPANDKLVMDVAVVTPAGVVAQAVGSSMVRTIQDIREQAAAILAQGGMTDADANDLRLGAWAKLTQLMAQQGYGLQGLPPELRNLYDAWIEHEIGSLSRRGQMRRIQREMESTQLEMDGLTHEMQNLAEQSRLLDMVPRWRLRDLSGVELAPAVTTLGAILSDYAAPVLGLRDPGSLDDFQVLFDAQLEQLLQLPLETPNDDVASELRQFGVAVRNAVAAAEFDLPSAARRTVVVAFPRAAGACEGLCDQFRQAPQAAAQRAWASLEGGQHVSELLIDPASLYSVSGGNAQLACADQMPVVRRSAVYLVNPIDTAVSLPSLGRELPAVAGRGGADFRFPRVGGTIELAADTAAGVPLTLPALNGSGGDVLPSFATNVDLLGTGAGISPFTAFTVDFGSFYSSLPYGFIDNTQAILLVMEVERRVDTSAAFVPGACQNVVSQ
jgi:hypothetical protein